MFEIVLQRYSTLKMKKTLQILNMPFFPFLTPIWQESTYLNQPNLPVW